MKLFNKKSNFTSLKKSFLLVDFNLKKVIQKQ